MDIISDFKSEQSDHSITALAVAMQNGPGTYAVLLASGVSRGAGIATGWEMTLDLVRKLPDAPQTNDNGEIELWYRQKHGKEPNYSDLMQLFGNSQADRRNLLKPYFEPTEDEAKDGIKVPSKAHRSIAKLVRLGLVRVILTTNFDRLMEQALRDEGIEPDVIFNPAMIDGTTPYAHSKCLIVKLHGDYMDYGLLNTPEELENYDEKLAQYLSRLLEDFGLVVCGWSAEWDGALVRAILGTANRRFGMYWFQRGEPSETAQRIIAQRRATVVPVESADRVFWDLSEKATNLVGGSVANPIDLNMVIASTKRYLSDPQHRISLRDLLYSESKLLSSQLNSDEFQTYLQIPLDEFNSEFLARLPRYGVAIERLVSAMCLVAYYGDEDQCKALPALVEQMIRPRPKPMIQFQEILVNLTRYPALLAIHAVGTAALAAENYGALVRLIKEPHFQGYGDRRTPLIKELNPYEIVGIERSQGLFPEKRYAPMDDYLAQEVPRFHSELHFTSEDEERLFEELNVVIGIAHMNANDADEWAPVGRAWKFRGGWDESPRSKFLNHHLSLGEDSPLLQNGLIGGDATKFAELAEGYKQHARTRRHRASESRLSPGGVVPH